MDWPTRSRVMVSCRISLLTIYILPRTCLHCTGKDSISFSVSSYFYSVKPYHPSYALAVFQFKPSTRAMFTQISQIMSPSKSRFSPSYHLPTCCILFYRYELLLLSPQNQLVCSESPVFDTLKLPLLGFCLTSSK